LDEALSFPVGLRMIRATADRSDVGALCDAVKHLRHVGAAIVGEHPLDDDAAPGKPADRPPQEGRRRLATLIREDFDIGDPAVIIDGDVRVFVPGAVDQRATRRMRASGLMSRCTSSPTRARS
jgi:hypothetical protein